MNITCHITIIRYVVLNWNSIQQRWPLVLNHRSILIMGITASLGGESTERETEIF
jgi:hypothetical protein